MFELTADASKSSLGRSTMDLSRRREMQATDATLEGRPRPHMPPEHGFGQRPSRRSVPGLPRPATFRRQDSELRHALKPLLEATDFKGRTATKTRSDRRRALSAEPVQDEARDSGYALFDGADDCVKNEISVNKVTTVGNDTSAQKALDEQLQHELDTKWILNLSMHFKDKSPREKFFITYAETPTKWRRLTVSCDYRNAPPDSLEHDLKTLQYQRDRSARIYEVIRASLSDIQFYDTVTSLKIETQGERLHVHVTEDVNEIIRFPADHLLQNVGLPRIPESQIQLESHISGYMYKVRAGGVEFIKKEPAGPDSVDDFLEELMALDSLKDSRQIKLEGLVVNEKLDVIKGLLIRYAEQVPLARRLKDIKHLRAAAAASGESSGLMDVINMSVDPKTYEEMEFYSKYSSGKYNPWKQTNSGVPKRNAFAANASDQPAGKSGLPSRKATAKDDRSHNIPSGYSPKHWDLEEQPILLLGSVFDANSLGKWIYDARSSAEPKRFFDVPTQKGSSIFKLKQGLVGFANGADIAALADTGSRKNIISASYAEDLGLKVEGSPSSFEVGNAQKIQSLGTVSLLWAFAENPKETFSIICDVLPRCTYSLILGNGFLSTTETMSRFRHRLTKCLFSVINNVPHFGFLGETYQRLEGTVADAHPVLAIPDTGAERNVMSLHYAIENGLELKTGSKHRGYLQFADGSFDETVGQVETYWTFASGQRIPITFEVLEHCCSDVIIGEDILTEHNVFQEHAASIFSHVAFDSGCYELVPFDFVNSWQRGCDRLLEKVASKKDSPQHKLPAADAKVEEQHRRNVWNHKYDFGASATTGEKELELARRERYESARSAPQARMPVVPSIPTSQSRR